MTVFSEDQGTKSFLSCQHVSNCSWFETVFSFIKWNFHFLMLNCVFFNCCMRCSRPWWDAFSSKPFLQENWHNLINSCSLFRRGSISIELLLYKNIIVDALGVDPGRWLRGLNPHLCFHTKNKKIISPLLPPKRKKKQVARSEPWLTCLHGRLIAKCTTSAMHIIGKNIVFIMVIGLSGVQFGL